MGFKLKRKVKRFIYIGIITYTTIFFLQKVYAHRSDFGEDFKKESQIECVPLFGLITMEDRVISEKRVPLVELQPGDILITLSTHSLGWRHGHAGLAIDEDTVLECVVIGRDSELVDASHWNQYSNFAVLRVKDISEELRKEVADYALENLCGVPYHLSSGFIGKKDSDVNEAWFGAHCSYLVWYAWNQFGYDLDSDGGRLVTCRDLLQSELVEVVQMYEFGT